MNSFVRLRCNLHEFIIRSLLFAFLLYFICSNGIDGSKLCILRLDDDDVDESILHSGVSPKIQCLPERWSRLLHPSHSLVDSCIAYCVHLYRRIIFFSFRLAVLDFGWSRSRDSLQQISKNVSWSFLHISLSKLFVCRDFIRSKGWKARTKCVQLACQQHFVYVIKYFLRIRLRSVPFLIMSLHYRKQTFHFLKAKITRSVFDGIEELILFDVMWMKHLRFHTPRLNKRLKKVTSNNDDRWKRTILHLSKVSLKIPSKGNCLPFKFFSYLISYVILKMRDAKHNGKSLNSFRTFFCRNWVTFDWNDLFIRV